MPPANYLIEPSKLVQAAAAGTLAALVVALLYFGRPVLVPFALATLLAFALSPGSEYLRRLGLPHAFAVALTVATTVVVIGGFGTFVGAQVELLASDLPQYQVNITHKIESIRGAASGNSLFTNVSTLFSNLNKVIGEKPPLPQAVQLQGAAPATRSQRVIPVEIRQPDVAPFALIESVIGPLLEPLATLSLSIIFVVFILLQKEDLRNRFISLAGSRDIRRTSALIDDGAQRLSRYLLMQTGINAAVGLAISIGLWICGVPNPALWGLIAAVFRFVPYVGMPAAAILPLALALAVDPGWTMVALVGSLYFVTEAIVGQAIEPWLYGRSVGLSPIAILLSAAFWTWVWGPLGLLLSTPLTMCVVVLGRHVEQLQFLDTMLGDRPALSSEERFYLHLLKGNPDELAEHAESFLKEKPLAEYYDEVALKGLALARLDTKRDGAKSDDSHDKILQTVEGLLANLADHVDRPATQQSTELATPGAPVPKQLGTVLCVAGQSSVDRAAATFLKDLLARRGIEMLVLNLEDASVANIGRIDPSNIMAICLSYIEPESPANTRFLARRLKKHLPKAPLIAGFWGIAQSDTHYLDWIEASESDFLAKDLASAVKSISALALAGDSVVMA